MPRVSPEAQSSPCVYVVRIWLEPSMSGPGCWRASVNDVGCRETHYFASPRALAAFLQLEASEEGAETPR